MARHAQPREVAAAKGATRKHPERYRKEPPAVKYGLGDAPEHMSDASRAVWFELQTYAPIGVLTGADRVMLEVAANLVAEYRENPREFPNPRIAQMVSCLARMGFSVADRQKLGTEKAKKGNEFDAF